MNVVEAVMLTSEGWRQLHDELAHLQVRRADVAEEPLDDTGVRPELAALETRIDELHRVLQRAIPVDRADLLPDTVGVGSNVTVRWGDGDEETYTLVGPPEIEPRSGKISYESPVGRALIGRRSGEQVTVATIDGASHLQILMVGHGADAG
jgi:transcription elongation factor GreA